MGFGNHGDALCGDDDLADVAWGPEEWEALAITMRDILHLDGITPQLLRDGTFFIRRIARLRMSQVLQNFESKSRLFSIDHIVRCVVFSGCLKDTGLTQTAILNCIRFAVRDLCQRLYLEDVIRQPGSVPSPTTLLRNRLTVHMGWRALQQTVTEELMTALGGLCSWGTQDLTSSNGQEYHMSLRTDFKVADLEEAYDVSQLVGVRPLQKRTTRT